MCAPYRKDGIIADSANNPRLDSPRCAGELDQGVGRGKKEKERDREEDKRESLKKATRRACRSFEQSYAILIPLPILWTISTAISSV